MFISFKDYCSSHACISCLSRTCVCVWRGGGSDVAVVELRQEGRGRSGHPGDRWGGGGGWGGSSRWSGWSFCRKTKLKLVPLRSQVLHSSGFFCCFQPSIYPHPPPADEHALRRTNCTHTHGDTHTAPQLSPFTALEFEQTSPLAILSVLPHSAKPVEPSAAAFCVGQHRILFGFFLFVFFALV